MSSVEGKKSVFTELLDKLDLTTIAIKNIIKELPPISDENKFLLEKELDLLKNNKFSPSKQYKVLSSILIQNEVTKVIETRFSVLTEFDEKTEKLKKLEKQFKKESSNLTLKNEIEKLTLSRAVEKKKFATLIDERNQFNKEFKEYLKNLT